MRSAPSCSEPKGGTHAFSAPLRQPSLLREALHPWASFIQHPMLTPVSPKSRRHIRLVLNVVLLKISQLDRGKESACQCRRPRLDPWVGKIPWRREWLPTPVCSPGESHGERSLAGHSPWGHRESNPLPLPKKAAPYSFLHLGVQFRRTQHSHCSARRPPNSCPAAPSVWLVGGWPAAAGGAPEA